MDDYEPITLQELVNALFGYETQDKLIGTYESFASGCVVNLDTAEAYLKTYADCDVYGHVYFEDKKTLLVVIDPI